MIFLICFIFIDGKKNYNRLKINKINLWGWKNSLSFKFYDVSYFCTNLNAESFLSLEYQHDVTILVI